MSSILISGGAGFIGTALAKKLKSLNHNVVILDLEQKYSAIHNEFQKFAIDIRDYKNFQKLGNTHFDYIFHLAAQTSSLISQEDPELDVDTNVKGTLNICNFAKHCGSKKIIFSSSMTVYGDHPNKINEDTIKNPPSNYGISKVVGEFYLQMYQKFGINFTIFRLFNAYGPGQDMSNMKQGMASIFMAQSILSNQIKVTGSLNRYRDFVYIDDIVEALILGLKEETDNEIYNVGSEEATTVESLINHILIAGNKSRNDFEIINVGNQEGDTFGSVADTSKLRKLGWQPKMNLQNGLKLMHQYAKDYYNEHRSTING